MLCTSTLSQWLHRKLFIGLLFDVQRWQLVPNSRKFLCTFSVTPRLGMDSSPFSMIGSRHDTMSNGILSTSSMITHFPAVIACVSVPGWNTNSPGLSVHT